MSQKILSKFNKPAGMTFRQAAVLIPIFQKNGEWRVLLTERSQEVAHHKGQICFPGGVREDQDESLWHTALRETEEEIGIESHEVFYVAELPQIHTPTRYEVTPFVGFLHSDFTVLAEPGEIADVFSVPIKSLVDGRNVRFEERELFGQSFQIPFFTYQKREIWGATGRMIVDFLSTW